MVMMAFTAVKALSAAAQAKAQAKIDIANMKVHAKQAELQGAVYGMQLTQSFNKSMASDVVMAASQNRRGGSVAAIASASESQFNWDIDFAELSTEIKMTGLEFNMEAAKLAGDTAATAALVGGAMDMYGDYQKVQARKSVDNNSHMTSLIS